MQWCETSHVQRIIVSPHRRNGAHYPSFSHITNTRSVRATFTYRSFPPFSSPFSVGPLYPRSSPVHPTCPDRNPKLQATSLLTKIPACDICIITLGRVAHPPRVGGRAHVPSLNLAWREFRRSLFPRPRAGSVDLADLRERFSRDNRRVPSAESGTRGLPGIIPGERG